MLLLMLLLNATFLSLEQGDVLKVIKGSETKTCVLDPLPAPDAQNIDV